MLTCASHTHYAAPCQVVRRAIGEAASAGNVQLLERLLGATVRARSAVSFFSACALLSSHSRALACAHPTAAQRGGHINAPCGVSEGTRRTPLHCAAAGGHTDCVQLLLRHSAEVGATCEGGRTALHLAASGGSEAHAACTRLLLRYGVRWDQPDLQGATPLVLARQSSQRECEELLTIVESGSVGATAAISPPEAWSGIPAAKLLPGGPLRYSITPAPPKTPAAWVGPLMGMANDGDQARAQHQARAQGAAENAWWYMEHPVVM